MNFIKLFLLILVGLIVGSCQQPQQEHRKDLVLIHQIMNDHIQHMKDKYQMTPVMRGGGFMDDINEVGLGFFYVDKGSIESARKLIVYGAEKLLKSINDSEEIRPYLHNYPFTAENLNYSITFVDENLKIRQEEIARTLLIIGNVSYSVDGTPEKPGYQKVFGETYEEALEIVKRDHPELLEHLEEE